MFLYQCQLAWRSIKKNPLLCSLMVLSLASGISAAMISYAQQYVATRNPLIHKDDKLFMVQTDSWHLKEAYQGQPLNEMPDHLSYRDTMALMQSTIPAKKVAMVHTGGALSIPGSDITPFLVNARITTRDYFSVFEESFLFGDVWNQAADESFQNLIVLSEDTNKRLFQGQNSIGKTLLYEGRLYQVMAVVKARQDNRNKMQDIDRSIIYPDDQVYFPFAMVANHQFTIWAGGFECPDDARDYGAGYQAHLKDSCVWLSYWVEFSHPSDKKNYEEFISQYILEQKSQGFYPRPLRFSLANASEKLIINRYDSGFSKMMVYFGFGFLAVCTINCIAMLLAKFLKHAPESGVRRALGASRATIFHQHLLESVFIGVLGGLLGILFTYVGLALLRYGNAILPSPIGVSMSNTDAFYRLDGYLLVLTIVIAVVASVCAGLYPAWRICRTPAALYLKLQ